MKFSQSRPKFRINRYQFSNDTLHFLFPQTKSITSHIKQTVSTCTYKNTTRLNHSSQVINLLENSLKRNSNSIERPHNRTRRSPEILSSESALSFYGTNVSTTQPSKSKQIIKKKHHNRGIPRIYSVISLTHNRLS